MAQSIVIRYYVHGTDEKNCLVNKNHKVKKNHQITYRHMVVADSHDNSRIYYLLTYCCVLCATFIDL